MGTTLTGTTPQDTYDSLIKVTDNGPLSGTAKYLSDGLGNDSVLALSTARVGVGKIPDTYRLDLNAADGNIARFGYTDADATFEIAAPAVNTIKIGAVSGDALALAAGGTEYMRITSAGNVGIGTNSPSSGKLQVKGSGSTSGTNAIFVDNSVGAATFAIRDNGDAFLSGNVGIGTATPARPLTIRSSQANATATTYTGALLIHDEPSGTSPHLGIGVSYNGGNEHSWIQSNNTSGAYTLAINPAGGNVGIGTSSPDQKLNIVGSQTTAYAASSGSEVVPLGGVNMTLQNTGTGGFTSMRFVSLDSSNAIGYMGFTNTTSSIGGAFVFGQRSGGGYAEQVRIQEGGGISFNGDTAAANALDDYEEGTWTPALAFSLGSTGITYSVQAGKYVKVGSKVSVNCYIVLSSKGSSTGNARVDGLPFTVPNNSGNYSAASFYNDGNVSFVGQAQGFVNINSTNIQLGEVTELGVNSPMTNANFANNSAFMLSATYFVS